MGTESCFIRAISSCMKMSYDATMDLYIACFPDEKVNKNGGLVRGAKYGQAFLRKLNFHPIHPRYFANVNTDGIKHGYDWFYLGGETYEDVTMFYSLKKSTLNQVFRKGILDKGRFVVFVSGHAFAVVNGQVVWDWIEDSKTKRHKVTGVFRREI